MDEHGLIKVRCKTHSCIHQGQGENCWCDLDEGPLIEDKICKSYEKDEGQSSGENRTPTPTMRSEK